MNNGKCKNCETWLPRHSSSRRQFCNDLCRLQYNRAQKATPKNELKAKAEKYDNLVRSIQDSINRLDKQSAKAEECSHDMSRPLNERMTAVAMFREKKEVSNELRLLLDMNTESTEPSFQERIAAIYNVDPVNYD